MLIVGGRDHNGAEIASAEIFDPTSGTWESAGQMQRARRSPVVNILLDGSILVRGGFDDEGWIDTREAFDPVTRTWTER